MAVVGSMGSILFTVSSNRVRTFTDFQRSGSAKMSTHDIIGKKGETEFSGLDPESISMTIKLRTTSGVSPNYELKRLRTMRDTGKVFPLILGGRKIGDNYWTLTALNEKVTYWTLRGNIQEVVVGVTLTEYKSDDAVTATNPLTDISDQISAVVNDVEDTIETARSTIWDLVGGMF